MLDSNQAVDLLRTLLGDRADREPARAFRLFGAHPGRNIAAPAFAALCAVPLTLAKRSLCHLDDYASGMRWLDGNWRDAVALCRVAGAPELDTRCWQLAYTLRGYFYLTKQWGTGGSRPRVGAERLSPPW